MSGGYERIGDAAGEAAPGAKKTAAPPGRAQPAAAVAADRPSPATHLDPELNIYLDPLNPSSEMTLKDRIQLVGQSARPWTDFFDFRMFNIPPLSEFKVRVQSNVETFFYNYFIIGLIYLAVFALGHPFAVLALVLVLGVAFFLYVLKPEQVTVAGLQIGPVAKHVVVAVISVLALTVGHVLELLFSLAVFLLLVVGIHSAIREHTA